MDDFDPTQFGELAKIALEALQTNVGFKWLLYVLVLVAFFVAMKILYKRLGK